MRRKLLLFCIVLFSFFLSDTTVCHALTEPAAVMLEKQLSLVNVNGIETALNRSANESLRITDFKTLVLAAIRGELALTPTMLLQWLADGLFGEVTSLISMMRHMLVIAVLGAVCKALLSSFKQKEVSELGFYVHCLLMLGLLLSSFALCIGLMQALVGELCTLVTAAQPALLTVVTISGNPAAAITFAPILLFAADFAALLIQTVIAPAITLTASLQFVNCLTDRPLFQKLADLLRGAITWALRLTALGFMAVLSLQRLSAPIMTTAVGKTAKLAVNAIPIVGNVMAEAVDTVGAWAGAVRSGVLAAVLIVLVLLCAAPLLKLLAFTLVYKLTAALMQPISDERIVKAIDAAGTFSALVLSACAMMAAMFMFMIMIILTV